MDRVGEVVTEVDYILDSKRKSHLVGGILLSISALFFGLAITIMTLQGKGEN